MRNAVRNAVRTAIRGAVRGVSSSLFVTEWDTIGAAETLTLPATSASNDFLVDWGDDSVIEAVTTANPSHEYAVAGTYNISISGTCPAWSFNNAGDKLKIKDVKNWGRVGFTDLAGGFWGCSNMTTTATDAGGFGLVTTMSAFCLGASMVNPYTRYWDVSSLSIANSAFNAALAADPDMSLWNVTSLTTAINMMNNSSFSDVNYDLMLASWSQQALNSGVQFHAGSAQYTEVAARLILTDPPNSWIITDGGPA